jgi:two-component system, OmpR family, sensor kinase
MVESRLTTRAMAGRVARVAIGSGACAGVAAAIVAIFAVDRLISEQAEVRLRAATVTLAGELREERKGPWLDTLREVLDDENAEIESSGIRLSVRDAGRVLAGHPAAPAVRPDSCETRLATTGRVRACARRYRSWTLIAAQPIDEERLYGLYALSLLGAVGLGALVGGISSVGLTRWAVAPLAALTRALRQTRPTSGRLLELGPPSQVEEVEAVRSALAERARQIQGLLEQTGRFAADAAHELRTPLTALRAELELALEEGTAADARVLERAVLRVARLSELINRLLILALPESDLARGFEAVSITDVAEDVIAELSELERPLVRLEGRSEGTVRGDTELLRSLLANALGNALKFAPHEPVTLRITERAEDGVDTIVIETIDRGPGVPGALRDRVFEPFYRIHADATRGHGLGLALIGHIARVHGGRAHFVEVGSGAVLEVVLPAWRAAH